MYRILCALFFCLLIDINSQAQAVESKLEFEKTQQPVAIIELPCDHEIAHEAIKDYMGKKGIKASSFKGFTVFRSARLGNNDDDLRDLYFMVDRKSRQQKDMSVITLLTTKRNEDILARSLTDTLKIEETKSFLNDLAPFIETYNVNVQGDRQDAVIKKAEKKMNELLNDENDLNKRIRKLQDDLDENKRDQESQIQQLRQNLDNTDAKNKANKKLHNLLDDQGDLEKKLRKAQASLEQNRKDQEDTQEEINKQKQVLEAIKAKGGV